MLIAIATESAPAAIHFDSFASIQGLSLVGNAEVFDKVLRLTPARSNRAGAVWFREKQSVRSGFETTFQFQLTQQSWFFHGADGFAFVLQNSGPEALGGRGSAAGFGMPAPTNPRQMGIPWMIAVFFDTCRNPEEGDPSSNYVAIRANGGPGGMRWPAARLAFTPNLSVRLKDRKVHTARIVFQPPLLSVFLDGSIAPVLETAVDFAITTDHEGGAWVGFTAATGTGYENHDILNWSFSSTDVSSSASVVSSDITFPTSACLPNRNLCTPEHATVEQKGNGYHIILPANLEWGASIPNLSGRTVVVSNAHGVVCWDLTAQGSKGCNGPSGNSTPAGARFLAEDKAGGALIMKTRDERTWFSVNDRSGTGFQDNEGFFEFDLEFR
ncbi:MAG TPA: L-type lectin-domain containing protein [Bryobacteraceae bacterium]|jgi:hypothetical protein|nr:L-type lectin-domain containing protein [Bryobacteraceae bacterium]